MYGRIYLTGIVGLWLATTSWLLWQKVLPPLRTGEPPSYRSLLERSEIAEPVGWQILFNGRPLGWAVNTSRRLPGGGLELQSYVRFDQLPFYEMAPSWMFALWRLIDQPSPVTKLDLRSSVEVDRDGKLIRFRSLAGLEPLGDPIELTGQQQDNHLVLTVRSSGLVYSTEVSMQPSALLGEALSPQSDLPGLHAGQAWTIPIYSPLRPPNNPLEIYRATVEALETIDWQRAPVETWVVAYRHESGFASAGQARPQGRLWVTRDGRVLRQEALLMDRALVFERLGDEESRRLARNAQSQAGP